MSKQPNHENTDKIKMIEKQKICEKYKYGGDKMDRT